MGLTMGVVSEYAIRSILMISRRSRSREASRCSPRSERMTSWSPVKSLTWRGMSFASSIDGSGFTRRLTGVAAALMVVAHRSACSGSALMQRRRANMVRVGSRAGGTANRSGGTHFYALSRRPNQDFSNYFAARANHGGGPRQLSALNCSRSAAWRSSSPIASQAGVCAQPCSSSLFQPLSPVKPSCRA